MAPLRSLTIHDEATAAGGVPVPGSAMTALLLNAQCEPDTCHADAVDLVLTCEL